MRSIIFTAILCPALLATSAMLAGCNSMKSDVQTTDHAQAPQGGDMAMMLPPGWTEADMQACMEAGMTGPQHEMLAKSAGRWSGTSTMWMAPGMPPMTNDCNATITSLMDGRYTRCEYSGEMAGMGAFQGLGFNGFDNVSQKYVSTWMDNMGTGIMNGTGVASDNGRTMTWNFQFNCPMTKKMTTMREVERHPDANTMSLEMFGPDPKTGKEFQMMKIEMKRASGA